MSIGRFAETADDGFRRVLKVQEQIGTASSKLRQPSMAVGDNGSLDQDQKGNGFREAVGRQSVFQSCYLGANALRRCA